MKKDRNEKNVHKMWDPVLNQIVEDDLENDDIFDSHTHIYTEAGEKEGLFRYYVVFLPEKEKINQEKLSHVETIAKTLACIEFEHLVDFESIEIYPTYLIASVLISPDIAVVEYIESIIDMCRELHINLRLEHFVTNLHKPTETEIQNFSKKIS